MFTTDVCFSGLLLDWGSNRGVSTMSWPFEAIGAGLTGVVIGGVTSSCVGTIATSRSLPLDATGKRCAVV